MLSTIPHTFTSTSLLFPLQTTPNTPSLSLSLLSLSPPRRRLSRAQRTNGSARVSARKKPKKRGGITSLMEMEGIGSFGDELGSDFDGDGDGDDDDDDEDGETLLLPLEKMKEWLENKPRGFGEGKVYDTSVEDQLFEEMLQSRLAQAANLNNLKSKGIESKRDEDKKKANEVVPNGVRVRLANLPKKKNVHRDLSAAFKGVPGLISINPAVTGSKKTRDPICKGFGSVYFKSKSDASRFVETFSRHSIAFGKIQKQIKCELVDSPPKLESSHENSTGSYNEATRVEEVEVEVLEDDQSAEYFDTDDGSSSDKWEISISAELDDGPDDEYGEVYVFESDDDNEDLDSVTELELNASGSYVQNAESETPSIQMEEVRRSAKRLTIKDKSAKVPTLKPPTKGKEVKGPKLDIPGSAKKLKVKEKAVLNNVFSKYGKKAAVAPKKES